VPCVLNHLLEVVLLDHSVVNFGVDPTVHSNEDFIDCVLVFSQFLYLCKVLNERARRVYLSDHGRADVFQVTHDRLHIDFEDARRLSGTLLVLSDRLFQAPNLAFVQEGVGDVKLFDCVGFALLGREAD